MLFVDWVVAVALGVSVLLLAFIVTVTRRSGKYYSPDAEPIAVRQRNGYLCSSVVFAFMHYWCILFSILSTLVVLYIGCFETTGEPRIKARLILYSALSLFTTICPYVVNMLKISRMFRKAFCLVEETLLEGKACGEALKKSEALIAEGFQD